MADDCAFPGGLSRAKGSAEMSRSLVRLFQRRLSNARRCHGRTNISRMAVHFMNVKCVGSGEVRGGLVRHNVRTV